VSRTGEENSQLSEFGGNVRRERMARGLTQERLSELVDLNLRTLQKVEAGETNLLLTTVVRIHRALGCPWDTLMPRK
jgi:transcriptional regulator with XRE-family HTH domain